MIRTSTPPAAVLSAHLRRQLGSSVAKHPLRRQIIATATINHVLATSD